MRHSFKGGRATLAAIVLLAAGSVAPVHAQAVPGQIPIVPTTVPAAGLGNGLMPATGSFDNVPPTGGFFDPTFATGVPVFPAFTTGPVISPWFSPTVTVGPGVSSLMPAGFVQRANRRAFASRRVNPRPPARRQRTRNVRVVMDGPGAATQAAVLGSPNEPRGNYAIGHRAVARALAVTPVPERRVSATLPRLALAPTRRTTSTTTLAEHRIGQRMAAVMRRSALVPARVVAAGKSGVKVRLAGSGVRSYPATQVFLFRGGRLSDGVLGRRGLKRGVQVLVPERPARAA